MGDKEESLRVEKETVVTETDTSSMYVDFFITHFCIILCLRPTDEELLQICGGRTAHK